MSRPLQDWADLKYMPGSRTAHVFPFGVDKPLCNGLIDGSTWHGTGSWEEYEVALNLPRCVTCHELTQPSPTFTEFTAPLPLYAHTEFQD